MSGDTLKRVQAVKKWLEKAESSYSKHKDITGEINLIMAQAEMQRLKETRRPSSFYRWGLRGCAMIIAVGLFFGGSYLYRSITEESAPRTASIEMVQKDTPVSTVTALPEKIEKPEKESVEPEKDTVTVSRPVETELVHATTEVVTPQKASMPTPTVTTVEAPPPTAAPARPAPALSEKEIQSVVGEAGRTLRGQV